MGRTVAIQSDKSSNPELHRSNEGLSLSLGPVLKKIGPMLDAMTITVGLSPTALAQDVTILHGMGTSPAGWVEIDRRAGVITQRTGWDTRTVTFFVQPGTDIDVLIW